MCTKLYTYKQQLHILFLATNAVELLKCNVQVMRWALWIHLIYNYVSTLGPAQQPSSVLRMHQANLSCHVITYTSYISILCMHWAIYSNGPSWDTDDGRIAAGFWLMYRWFCFTSFLSLFRQSMKSLVTY